MIYHLSGRVYLHALLILFLFTGMASGAEEFVMKVMPAPPSPEADFTPETGSVWDVGIGYGRLWTDSPVDAHLDGFVTGVTWKGTIGRHVGVTAAPLYGGMYFGSVEGFDADITSVGTGFSFGGRLFGRPDGTNLILFGGGGYSYSIEREDQATGSYQGNSHLFGFTIGAKFQIAFHRFVRIVPFYLYMGGGGSWSIDSVVFGVPVENSGSLGYRDSHLLGLDFNIFGITAKLIADLLQDDYKSFTISVGILGTVRGVKAVMAAKD